MGKFTKELKGDLDEINRKLSLGVMANCPMTTKRDSWTTEIGDVKFVTSVFEKHAKKLWDSKDWKDQVHGTLTLTLIDTGEEIRLCAISAGSGQGMYRLPDGGPEGELMGALKTAVTIMDSII